MDRALIKKPRLHFDTEVHPSHVTFDDGHISRRNFPWLRYIEAQWDYAELDMIQVRLDEWLIIITGHNLAPLFVALEEQSLLRIRAQPQLLRDRERELDTFATAIRFLKSSPFPPVGQAELGLTPG